MADGNHGRGQSRRGKAIAEVPGIAGNTAAAGSTGWGKGKFEEAGGGLVVGSIERRGRALVRCDRKIHRRARVARYNLRIVLEASFIVRTTGSKIDTISTGATRSADWGCYGPDPAADRSGGIA